MSENNDIKKPFGIILKEILDKSSISREEFENLMNKEMKKCPVGEGEAGIVPGISVVLMMMDILKPSEDSRKALFRALAPLIAADENKPFSELSAACRLAIGLTLEEVGRKLNKMVPNGESTPGVRPALFEMGLLFPSSEEGEALAEIFIIPEKEHSIFTSKVAATLQQNLKIVDEDFVPNSGPMEEDIERAKKMVEEEKNNHTQFIVSAAADILKNLKDEEKED